MGEEDKVPEGVAGAGPRPSGEPPVTPSPWGLWDLGLFLAFGFFALLVAKFVTIFAYAALRPIAGWRVRPQDLDTNAFVLVAAQSLWYVFLLGYIYVLAVVKYRLGFWTALGWRPPTGRQVLQLMLGGILLGVLIAHAPTLLPDRDTFPLEELFSSPAAAYAVAVFAIFVAPLMEELIFRGVLFAFFERLVGLRFAIAATALLFAGLHLPEYWRAWNHALLILVVAVVLSLARGLTGSLAPSVILHLTYNATFMVALFFASQHFRAIH